MVFFPERTRWPPALDWLIDLETFSGRAAAASLGWSRDGFPWRFAGGPTGPSTVVALPDSSGVVTVFFYTLAEADSADEPLRDCFLRYEEAGTRAWGAPFPRGGGGSRRMGAFLRDRRGDRPGRRRGHSAVLHTAGHAGIRIGTFRFLRRPFESDLRTAASRSGRSHGGCARGAGVGVHRPGFGGFDSGCSFLAARLNQLRGRWRSRAGSTSFKGWFRLGPGATPFSVVVAPPRPGTPATGRPSSATGRCHD